MDSDGSGVVRLTPGTFLPSCSGDANPSVSPDGLRIAFDSCRDGDYDVYAVGIDGSGLTKLTNDASDDRMPTWSPDGSRIAFASNRAAHGKSGKSGDSHKIWTMSSGGGDPTCLTPKSKGDDIDPAWSPDGTRVAFASDREGPYEIHLMNSDGSNQIVLTEGSGDGGSGTPAWSPDGSKIAFGSSGGGGTPLSREIYVMTPSGGDRIRLTDNSSFDGFPAWSPSGGSIAFATDRTGNREIWLMGEYGSGLTRLTYTSATDESPGWLP